MWNAGNKRLGPMTRREAMGMALVAISVVSNFAFSAPTVLDFDDLPYQYNLTANGYAGLVWGNGNGGYNGNIGFWEISQPLSNGYPHSLPSDVMNAWGCTQIGIGFPSPVNMGGVYVAGQSNGPYTTGIRVHAYMSGQTVAVTDWFTNISTIPAWFDMSALVNVDRIVFESVPVYQNTGIYGLDDLTFTYVPEPAGLAALSFAAAALLARKGRRQRDEGRKKM